MKGGGCRAVEMVGGGAQRWCGWNGSHRSEAHSRARKPSIFFYFSCLSRLFLENTFSHNRLTKVPQTQRKWTRRRPTTAMYSTLVDSQRKMASLIEHLTSMTQIPAQQIHEYPSFIGTETTTKHTQNTMQTQQSEPLSQISDPISPIFKQNAETNQERIQ